MDNKIKEVRIAKNIKQDHLAKEVGITRTALSSIENGTAPRLSTAFKLSKILGLPIEELFKL